MAVGTGGIEGLAGTGIWRIEDNDGNGRWQAPMVGACHAVVGCGGVTVIDAWELAGADRAARGDRH